MTPYRHKVQYYETDRMQITHHSNYLRFMEEARIDFFEQLGWGYDKIEKMGVVSPVLEITCEYRKMTTYPDIIEIRVDVLKVTPIKLTLKYTMTVGEAVVCTAKSSHCFLDEKGDIVSSKKRFPEFYEILSRCVPEDKKSGKGKQGESYEKSISGN